MYMESGLSDITIGQIIQNMGLSNQQLIDRAKKDSKNS